VETVATNPASRSVHHEAISRHAIAPSDDAGRLRLLGSAATGIGAFDLAPAFLAGAVAGLRAQGRLGQLV
jgi:hypothetical protein